MSNFRIPVVLFVFKRYETTKRIIDRLRAIKVAKIYILGDGPRNEREESEINECRSKIESFIDWDCEVVRNYAKENRGVFENIGNGARWVLERERSAIFLEDDNLPELTFFNYCEELLSRYEMEENVLWINGTNYLTEYYPKNGSSYMFTKQLLPCGWATWSEKFLKYYDGNLKTIDDPRKVQAFRDSYLSHKLFNQQNYSIRSTKRKAELGKPISWDFQMCFSIRSNNLYGIAPCRNQIENIGVDNISTHGGTSLKKTMTRRFCGMTTMPLEFPLNHPINIEVDSNFEMQNEKLITWPMTTRIQHRICGLIKPLLRMDKYDSMSKVINDYKKRKRN